MADHVVVERRQFSAPDSSVAVCAFTVAGIVQALAEGAPLHGEVVVVVERCHLID